MSTGHRRNCRWSFNKRPCYCHRSSWSKRFENRSIGRWSKRRRRRSYEGDANPSSSFTQLICITSCEFRSDFWKLLYLYRFCEQKFMYMKRFNLTANNRKIFALTSSSYMNFHFPPAHRYDGKVVFSGRTSVWRYDFKCYLLFNIHLIFFKGVNYFFIIVFYSISCKVFVIIFSASCSLCYK